MDEEETNCQATREKRLIETRLTDIEFDKRKEKEPPNSQFNNSEVSCKAQMELL